MSKHHAESWDADWVARFLRERGHEHLRVRHRGSFLTIESGPTDDPVKHARLCRQTDHLWTLDMADHKGRWEPTGLRDECDKLLTTLVEQFGWTLSPIV